MSQKSSVPQAISFVSQVLKRDNDWTYWVPFLYRDALSMSQGAADD
jgi:hypothetical protein